MSPLFVAVVLVASCPWAMASEFAVRSLAPAAVPPKTEASFEVVQSCATYTATVTSDWLNDREEAWRDARRKAFEHALGPYRVTGSSITVKGSLRRVKLHIEWTPH